MNKSVLAGSILGATLVTAGGVGAFSYMNQGEYAEVIDVKPIVETVRTPREACHSEVVTSQAPTSDPNQVTGTVIGAIAGGVLGNQVGGGSGKKVATVAGAAAGGYAGNKVQENMQANNTVQSTERVCETAYDSHENTVAYQVTYLLDDKEGSVRMDHDPGRRIPVEDGRIMLQSGPADNEHSAQ